MHTTNLLLRYSSNTKHFWGEIHALKILNNIGIVNGMETRGLEWEGNLFFVIAFCKIEFYDHVSELLNKKGTFLPISYSPRICQPCIQE